MYCCKKETVRPPCNTKIEHSFSRKQEAEGLATFLDVDNHLKSDRALPTLMPDGTAAHLQSNEETSKTNRGQSECGDEWSGCSHGDGKNPKFFLFGWSLFSGFCVLSNLKKPHCGENNIAIGMEGDNPINEKK